MDTGIIHDDDRVQTREWIHVVEKSINETIELFCSIRMVFNSEVEDPIERESGKN